MYKTNSLYGVATLEQLYKILGIDEVQYNEAMKRPYNSYYRLTNGKKRYINEPNSILKGILRALLECLKTIEVPDYCYGLSKERGTIENARRHTNMSEILNFDISNYYPNSKSMYVEEFFKNKLKISGEALEAVIKMTTCDGHISTGAPTSPMLAFLTHEGIFNRIHKKMMENDINMTIYFDDLSFSAKKHLGSWIYDYCKKSLKQHGLWIKSSKIKHFGYKGGWVTGVRTSQSGKLSAPHKSHYKVINLLKNKPIEEMDIDELRRLLGLIAYLQQINCKSFRVTKQKARIALKKLVNKNK